jgi:hypothetical protein
MGFIGYDSADTGKVFFMIFAVIAAILFIYQLKKLLRMKILPVYLLPFLSICLFWENIVLFLGAVVQDNTIIDISYVLYSLIIPLFVIIIFELAYRLFEARSANFLWIPFDERGTDDDSAGTNYVALATLWFVRLCAIALFILNIIKSFSLFDYDSNIHGRNGYKALETHPLSIDYWLSYIPPIFLSIISLVVGISLYSYGNNLTIGLLHTRRWRLILPCVICQAIGQVFYSSKVYPTTSNAGEVILLLGTTLLLHLVQKDLARAGSFADFLRKSNIAFNKNNGSLSSVTSYNNINNSREISMSVIVNENIIENDIEDAINTNDLINSIKFNGNIICGKTIKLTPCIM